MEGFQKLLEISARYTCVPKVRSSDIHLESDKPTTDMDYRMQET